MLKKTAKSKEELVGVMAALETLGFAYTMAATPVNGVFTYDLTLGEAETVTEPEKATQEPETRDINRRKTADILKESQMIAEYLKDRGGDVPLSQIYKAMKRKGCTWKEQSAAGIVETSMKHDTNIIKVKRGIYAYGQLLL